MLAFKQVCVGRGKDALLKNAALRIDPGTVTAIVGPAGTGKSVLIDLLLGKRLPDSGNIAVDGVDIEKLPRPILQLYRRRVGVMWQTPHLLPHLTIRENVQIPLELAGAPKNVTDRNVNDLLTRFDIRHLADAFPSALSLSQRMCACIARAVCASPYIVIADDPFALLDVQQTGALKEIFSALSSHGTTLILLLQSEEDAPAKARIVRLQQGVFKERNTAATVHMGSKPAPHRILEEIHDAVTSAIKRDLQGTKTSGTGKKGGPAPRNAKSGGGKKIRVTAIGSGL